LLDRYRGATTQALKARSRLKTRTSAPGRSRNQANTTLCLLRAPASSAKGKNHCVQWMIAADPSRLVFFVVRRCR
jgi:hypothetical protein